MSEASGVESAMRAARERLRALGLPEHPSERWSESGDDDLDLQINAVTESLYGVITFGEKALEAQAAGDWEGFAAAYKTMLFAEQSSRLPQIAERFHKQRQRTSAKKPRSEGKQTARRLYDEHHPVSAKDLLKLLDAAELKRKPGLPTVSNWLSEFRQKK